MQNRIRIKSTEGDGRSPVDLYTGVSPAFYRANHLAIEVGIFGRGTNAAPLESDDLAGVTGIRLRLMTANAHGGPGGEGSLLYWDELVEPPFGEVTPETWADGTAAHVTFNLAPGRTALPAGKWWVWCVTEGAAARTLFAGAFMVRDDGSQAGDIPDAPPLEELRDAAAASAAAAAAEVIRAAAEADRSRDEADRSHDEAQRAQTIVDNLATLGASLKYRGTWSTNVAPVGPDNGNYWIINAVCTFGGHTYATGDAALYSVSDGWGKVALATINAALDARVAQLETQMRRREPIGGVQIDEAGYITLPITGADLPLTGFSFSLFFRVETAPAAGGATKAPLMGNARGIASPGNGQIGVCVSSGGNVIVKSEAASSDEHWLPGIGNIWGQTHWIVGVVDAAGQLTTYWDGLPFGMRDWSGRSFASPAPWRLYVSSTSAGGVVTTGSATGAVYHCAVYDKPLSAAEVASLAPTNGRVTPPALRGNVMVAATLDDGVGYQFRDRSAHARHPLATTTGVDHLIPREAAALRARAVNATSAMYLLRAGDVLPVGAVVTQVIVDGECNTATYDQTRSFRRVRLEPTGGGNIDVQRSDGATHEIIASYTPANPAACDVKILYQINN